MEQEAIEQGTPMGSPTERWIVLGGIFAAVALSVVLRYEPHSFLRRDASFYATITRGLAENGSLRAEAVQPASWYSGDHPGYQNLDASWSNVSLGPEGEWYPKHSFVMPSLALPFYELFGTLGLLLFNMLGVIALLYAAFLVAGRYIRGPPLFFALLLTATGATFIEHTYHFSADIFTAAVTLWGMVLLQRNRALAAGLLFGLALWARPTLVLVIGPVGFALGYGLLDRRQAKQIGLGFLPCLLGGAVANWLMFGAPWTTSYDRILVVQEGVQMVDSASNLFGLGFGDGFKRMWLSPKDGFLDNAPTVLAGILGLIPLIRRAPRLALGLALAILAYIIVFTSYRYSNPRFFFAWMALLVAPLALLLESFGEAMTRLGPSLYARLGQGRARKILGLLAALTLALVVWRSATLSPAGATLSDRLSRASVSRDGLPCDYFNMRHGRWECSKVEKKTWEWVGRSLGDKECTFAGQKDDMLLFHPSALGHTKRLTFPVDAGEARLRLRFGLADTALSRRTCMRIEGGKSEPKEVCATIRGVLVEEEVTLGEAGEVSLIVDGMAGGRRHFCVQGTFLP